MDFALSEEQELLAQTLHRYLEEECPVTRVRELVAAEHGRDGGVWKALCEMGVGGLLIPEEYGGSGLGMLDAVVAAEALGYGVAPVPFLACAVMAPVAILAAGSPEQRRSLLPGLATGSLRIGVAATEMVSRHGGAGVGLRDGRLHGSSLMVLDATGAERFLVPVVTGAEGAAGLALVDAGATGLTTTPLPTVDRTRGFAELVFDGVEVAEWIGGPAGAAGACARMLDAGRVALAADALGAADRALELAVGYALQRKQFGRVIGSFQAVKHLCAEMAAEIEPARSLVWYAGHAFDHVPAEARLVSTQAKALLSEVAPFVVRAATEVHGGIGFTDEQNLHCWFKRAGVDRQLLGGPEILYEEAARLQGLLD